MHTPLPMPAIPNWQPLHIRIRTLRQQHDNIFSHNKMLVSLTVGKVDAGMAVLLTEDKRIVRLHSVYNAHRRINHPLPARTH
jgi:hypothetical protein